MAKLTVNGELKVILNSFNCELGGLDEYAS